MITRMQPLLLVSALLVAAPTLAQDAAPEDDGYAELVQEGVSEFSRGNWDESYLLFSQAHELQPNARTYRGMGLSAYEARQYVRAFVNLQAALTDERRPLSDAQRTEVETLIKKTARFIAKMTLAVSPAEATLQVDARKPVFDKDGALLLDRGTHEIVVKAPGHSSAIRRLVVRAGETGSFEVRLEPEGGPVDPGAEPVIADVSLEGVGAAPERNYVPVLIAGGAAVAFAATATVLYFMASGEADDIRSACSDGCAPADVDKRIDDGSIDGMQTTGAIFWVLAGGAAAAAGVLYYLEMGSETAAGEPSIGVAIGPNSAHLRAEF